MGFEVGFGPVTQRLTIPPRVMIPFLKPRQLASVLIAKRNSPEGKIEGQYDDPVAEEGLTQAAEDLLRAIAAKDAMAVAAALKAAYQLCDSDEPASEEGAQ